LDREVLSDWFGSNPSRPGASRVEVELKKDIFSICCWARLGSSMSLKLSMKPSRSLLEVDGEASSSLELARWLLKPPRPSGDANPGAEDEDRALVEHSTGEVERCQ
jgi:hypothetical protein